jgi:tRNA pseudouridine38-40 synthase
LSTRRIKLVVAYDGADFCGWAPQRDQRTVHGTLTDAVRRISGEEIEIRGASRTDSGAHAKGQVCDFATALPMPIDKWPVALNAVLPKDVAVVLAEEVSEGFDSRFWARWRRYRYRIQLGPRDPFRARYAFQPNKDRLDIEAMRRGAAKLAGEHDFLAFSQQLAPGQTAKRRVFAVDVRPVRDEIWIVVKATAYVRGMMRRFSGALYELGKGTREPEDIDRLLDLEGRDNLPWPTVLPAAGLTLLKVSYGRHPSDWRDRLTTEDLNEKENEDE